MSNLFEFNKKFVENEEIKKIESDNDIIVKKLRKTEIVFITQFPIIFTIQKIIINIIEI